jgi:hypothetical protein
VREHATIAQHATSRPNSKACQHAAWQASLHPFESLLCSKDSGPLAWTGSAALLVVQHLPASYRTVRLTAPQVASQGWTASVREQPPLAVLPLAAIHLQTDWMVSARQPVRSCEGYQPVGPTRINSNWA